MARGITWALITWLLAVVALTVAVFVLVPGIPPFEAGRLVGGAAVPAFFLVGLPFFFLGLVSAGAQKRAGWATGILGLILRLPTLAVLAFTGWLAVTGGGIAANIVGQSRNAAQRVEQMLYHASRKDHDSATAEYASKYSLERYRQFLAFARELGIDDGSSWSARIVDVESDGPGEGALVTIDVDGARFVLRVVEGEPMTIVN